MNYKTFNAFISKIISLASILEYEILHLVQKHTNDQNFHTPKSCAREKTPKTRRS